MGRGPDWQWPPFSALDKSYPTMLAKVWSHMYDREVVVA